MIHLIINGIYRYLTISILHTLKHFVVVMVCFYNKDINSEMVIGDQIGFERQFVDLHLRACIYAGLGMYGCVREMFPSQVN